MAEIQDSNFIEEQITGGGVRGDLNFKLVVMRQLDRVGQTLARLPHEMVDKDIGITGTTYKDIQCSFHDGVRLLDSLLEPYHDKIYFEKIKKLTADYEASKLKGADSQKTRSNMDSVRYYEKHDYYFAVYSAVISLCARLGLMLEQMAGDEAI